MRLNCARLRVTNVDFVDTCNDSECGEQSAMDKTNNEDHLIIRYTNLCDGDVDDCGLLQSLMPKRSLDRLNGGFIIGSKRSSLYRLKGDSINFAELCDDNECDLQNVVAKRSSLNRLNGGHVMESKRSSLNRLGNGHVMGVKRDSLDRLNGDHAEISKVVNVARQSLPPYEIRGTPDRFNPSFVQRPLHH